MSGFDYPARPSHGDAEESIDHDQQDIATYMQMHYLSQYDSLTTPGLSLDAPQGDASRYWFNQYTLPQQYPLPAHQSWPTPSNHLGDNLVGASFPELDTGYHYSQAIPSLEITQSSEPSSLPTTTTRHDRSSSLVSSVASATGVSEASCSEASRSVSPTAHELARWGTRNPDGSWSCNHTGCTSKSTFYRGCDLRKHHKRHTKTLFCSWKGCPQSTQGGFSSRKDRDRHEAKHNPSIVCEWEGCGKKFSRQDNMKDHVWRIHQKRAK